MTKKSTKRRRKKWPWLILFCLIVAGITTGLSCTVFFPVKTVQVSGSAYYQPEELIRSVSITPNDKLFGLRHGEVLQRVRQQLPYIKDVKVKRHLPDTIELVFSDCDCLLSFQWEDRTVVVDDTYRLCDAEPPIEPIRVNADWRSDDDRTRFSLADPKAEGALTHLLTAAAQRGLDLRELQVVNPEDLQILIGDRFLLKLGGTNYLNEKLDHAVSMIKTMNDEQKGQIDLREWSPDNQKAFYVESL